MSFGEPVWLVALLLVPAAIWVYLRQERGRRSAAALFAAPALQAAVAPVTPGWRRHAPLGIYAVALAALITALAKPQTTVAVPVERASIMLVTDYSGSMEATDVQPSRLLAARAAAEEFLDEVPGQIRVGVVAFNQAARTLQTPTTDRAAVSEALASLRPSGGTATGEALAAALGVLERQTGEDGRRAPGAIVLLSDGESTRGREPEDVARRARRLRVPVYTVALGTPTGTIEVRTRNGTETRRVPPDVEAMREVARIARGQAYSAVDAGALDAVYQQLGSRVGSRDEEREITAGFAGGALALLAAGALMSLHWFRRLP